MAEMSPAELSDTVTEVVSVLKGLQGSADQLTSEIEMVRADSAEVRKASKRTRLYALLAAAAVFLLLIVTSTAALLAKQGASEQEGRDRQTAAVVRVIQECTSPGEGHHCYTENQARSTQRLAPIVGVICAIGRAAGVPEDQLRPLCPPE